MVLNKIEYILKQFLLVLIVYFTYFFFKRFVLIFFGGWTKKSFLKYILNFIFIDVPKSINHVIGNVFLSDVIYVFVFYLLIRTLLYCTNFKSDDIMDSSLKD